MSKNLFAVAVLLAFLLAPQTGWSQETRGTIQGRVTDSSGAVVPGATIRATQLTTDLTQTTESNDTGNYTLPLLPAGTYTITGEKQGFKRFSRPGVELQINDTVGLNISLEVGSQTETVTVTAESPLLESENAAVGEVVDNKKVEDIPTAFNNEYLLMILSPATYNGGGNELRQQPWEPGATADVTMAGSGEKAASITLDGANNTSRDTGGGVLVPGFVPPADAVAEFKVQVLSFDGSTGSTQGGTMNVSLKSGTNQPHGTLFYSGVPENWTANLFFNNLKGNPRSPSSVRYGGGSINGPVYIPKVYNGKNKTFFMFDIEDTHYASPQAETTNVATAAQRTGDFSGLLAVGGAYQIYNPFSRVAIGNGRYQETPFPNNILPASLISPIATALINPANYPLPNATPTSADGANDYYTNASQTVKFNIETWRFDHNFNENTRMFVTLHRSDAVYRLPPWDSSTPLTTNSIYYGDTFGYQMSGFNVDVMHSFSPTFIMDTHVSDSRYIRISNASPLPGAQGIDLTKTYGFPAYYNNLFNASDRRTPNVTIAGYGSGVGGGYTAAGAYDSLMWYPQENRSAAISWVKTKGINVFKWGFEYRQERQGDYAFGGAAEGGTFTFDTTYTQGPLDNSTSAPNSRGQGFAAFLLGIPTSGTFQYVTPWYEMSTYYGQYFQDDIRITPKLTINLAFRYEVEGPLTERYNQSVRNFNPTLFHNFDAAVAAAYAQNPIAQMPVSQFSTLGGVQYAGVGGVPRELFQRDFSEIEPRAGFAYSINDKTVVRGGFGVYRGPLGMFKGDVNNLNYTETTNLVPTTNSGLSFLANLANPYPNGVLPIFGNSLGANTYINQSFGTGTINNPNPRAPKYEKETVTVQRQLPQGLVAEVGFIGSRAMDLATTRSQKYIPSQYLSRLPTRDQTLINYWTSNVPNPFYGLTVPGAPAFNNTTTPTALVEEFPQFTGLNYQTYEGWSTYRGLTAELRKRFAHGISGQFG